MTKDAFYKAEKLNKELEAISKMKNIISNSTLSGDEYYAAHDAHVTDDEMILCYMYRSNDEDYDETDVEVFGDSPSMRPIVGVYHMGGNYILGKDVPIGLVNELERTIQKYEDKINKKFKELTDDYTEEEED